MFFPSGRKISRSNSNNSKHSWKRAALESGLHSLKAGIVFFFFFTKKGNL